MECSEIREMKMQEAWEESYTILELKFPNSAIASVGWAMPTITAVGGHCPPYIRKSHFENSITPLNSLYICLLPRLRKPS
jgi:hypothetical protein